MSTHREVTLHFSVQTRIHSFIDYCAQHGVNVRHLSCKIADNGRYLISDVASRILSLDTLPTAIACQEDGLAIPLTFQLERSGVSVPNDVSVIGFDDGVYASDLGLTTIRQNPVDLGHKAAHMVLNLINGEELDNPFVTEDAELVIRSSTTRPR